MAVAIYTVQILLRMRAEEADGRLESVLAASVSRPRWMMSHLLNAGLGALLLLLVFAVSMGLAAGAVLGDIPAQLRALVEAGLVQLPAILLIAGVVVALTGAAAASGRRALLGAAPVWRSCSGRCSAPQRCSCRPGRRTSRRSPTRPSRPAADLSRLPVFACS